MSQAKKMIRSDFRDAVFKRDHYRCKGCGFQSSPERAEEELDAHHITDRNEMPEGGYVRTNGVTLCKHGESPTCHEKAEEWLNHGGYRGPAGYAPDELYQKIGSSYAVALVCADREVTRLFGRSAAIEMIPRRTYETWIGKKVKRASGKPFLSGLLENTVAEMLENPYLGKPCFSFEEDESSLECRRCLLVEGQDDAGTM